MKLKILFLIMFSLAGCSEQKPVEQNDDYALIEFASKLEENSNTQKPDAKP